MPSLQLSRYRLGWWSFGLALGAALMYVVYAFIGTFVFGVFIYYATRPIYKRLKKRIRPPSLAAAISLFALALPALVLVAYALSIAFGELLKYINGGALDPSRWPLVNPELLDSIADPATLLELGPEQYLTAEGIRSLVTSLGSAADTVAFVGIGAIHLFVMLALAFYLLRDGARLSKWAVKEFGDDRGVLKAYGQAVDRDFKGIFFGNILNAVLTGTIGVLTYSILNIYAPPGLAIPAAPLVGLLAGVASLIPIVGMKLVYIPVGLYLASIGILTDPRTLWFVAVFALISFVIVDVIPDLVLRPYVSGRSLHVGSLMIAYTFGPLLFGWYGIFLAPMLLVLVVHFARLVLPELLDGEPLRPYAVDPGTFAAEEAASASGDAVDVGDADGVVEATDISDADDDAESRTDP
ncbi:AI-2E family transporter [Haloplanus aerogenes]|uniref:AI-2E family transporter n=1 Tax=Haloplanus aerogenes TaxID=660522 RepID=A0A3M0DGH8_9EURY|nr:AI-2E family transporter [Haloplanus aerogenes]AZH26439.1 AI-2E family transporter [Haloplanus aerogenes]RMB18096.1 putative PurR-regulated permease PerM [Haloplanus aerogenes]